jgi:hypothetical protein
MELVLVQLNIMTMAILKIVKLVIMPVQLVYLQGRINVLLVMLYQ